MKKNNKGFTLVELIVVLVILAILAAILVPALLGYIDKARQGQYEEEAHSILVACQGYATEQYAKNQEPKTDLTNTAVAAYVKGIVDPTVVTGGTIVYKETYSASAPTKRMYTVAGFTGLKFKSQDTKEIECSFVDGAWYITKIGGKETGVAVPSASSTTPEDSGEGGN